MRIQRLVIDNFRGIEHLEMDGVPETGVIIVEGANEAGKSTILDAIDLVLRERSSSKKRQVKAVAPVGRDEAPEVRLTATVGEYRFEVYKRWLKGPKTELNVTAPIRRSLSGREAEDELERMLGEHLDRDLVNALFVRQGGLDPEVQAAGIPSIAAALQAATGSGDTVGGGGAAEDTALMAAVEAEYAKYWTAAATPKPRGRYAELVKAIDAARDEHREREQKVGELARYVDEVAAKQAEIRTAEEELPAAEAEAAELRAAADDAAKVRERAEGAADVLRQASVSLTRAEEDLARRTQDEERVAELGAAVDAAQAGVAAAREARDAEVAAVEERTAARDVAKTRVASAREAATTAARLRELAHSRRELELLSDQLEAVAAADRDVDELVAATPSRAVTDEDVREIEAAEAEVALARRLRDASAAKLEIAGSGRVTVDGAAVEVAPDEPTVVPVFDGTEVRLGDYAVRYRAAVGETDPAEALQQAEAALAALLEGVGCEDLAGARTSRDAHKDHAAALAAARRRRDDLLAGESVEVLRQRRAVLAAGVDTLAAQLGDAADAEAGDAEDLAAALEDAERELDLAEAALRPYAERRAAGELLKVETRAESVAAQLAAAQEELTAAEARTAKVELTAALETARAEVVAAKREADDLAAAATAADPDVAAKLAAGAEHRVTALRGRRDAATSRISELRGYIDLAEGAAERADKAAAELEKTESELERVRRRAEAARLLRDTMAAHRDDARARYAAPFAEAVRKHARVVYGPDVDFTLGDALEITDRTVAGTTVPLSELSGGAKEQLALLSRFAIADVVAAGSDAGPVPVVVDDALGATDPERLGRMNLLFEEVGNHTQVLVLTCFPQRFDRINAARRYSMSELRAAAK